MARTFILLMVCLFASAAFSQQQLGVIDLEAPGFDAPGISTLTNKLRSELVKTGKFLVLERAQMAEVLKEQGFQNTGCTSSECAVEMGQLLGVQVMAAGTIGQIGRTWSITLRLIDVRDGKLTKMIDYEMEGQLDDVLKFGITNAARKLCDLPINEFVGASSLEGAKPAGVIGCDSSLALGAQMAVNNYSLVNGWYVASSLFLFSYTVIYHFLASPPVPDLGVKVIREVKSNPAVDYECFKEGYGQKAKSRRGTSVLLGTLTCISVIVLLSSTSN